jgi:DNA-directed RNA polymerase specialized sigma24 family protein
MRYANGDVPSEDVISELLLTARRMAGRWCDSEADADDVAQEAVLRAISQSAPPKNTIAWMYVVTRRLSQRQRLRRHVQSNAEAAYVTREVASLDLEFLLDLEALLSRLAARDRRLLCRVAEGALSAELAVEFRCHVRDVGQMVARARKRACASRSGQKSPLPCLHEKAER